MSNSEYLKDALLQQAGSFTDFDAMRSYIRSFAKELLTTSQPDWFYKGRLMVTQEAQQSASSIEQHEFLKRYKQTLALAQAQQYDSLLDIVSDSSLSPESLSTSNTQVVVEKVQHTATIVQLIDLYINEKIANNEWSAKTLENRRTSFRVPLIQAFTDCGFHDTDINDITRPDLLKVRDKLAEKLKTSTLNARMKSIKSLFCYAETCQLLKSKSPADKLTIKDKSKLVDKHIPQNELTKFLKFMHSDFQHNSKQPYAPYLKWIVSIAAITGARQGEILQLCKGDIKQLDGVTYISINADDGKTLKNSNSERCVPLVDKAYGFDLCQFMDEVVNTCQNDTDYIFRASATTKSVPQMFSKIFSKYKKLNEAFPDEATFHSLRHSMSTLCLNKAMPEAFTGKLLGHAQGITYGRYGSSGVDMVTLHDELKTRVFNV